MSPNHPYNRHCVKRTCDSSCCSTLGYCGGVTGGADAWCKTMNLSNGIYDAVEPKK